MKTKLFIVTLLATFLLGCSTAAKPVAQNTNTAAGPPEKAQTAISHSSENQTPAPTANGAPTSKWKQSGDPIDTKEFDTAIASAEVALKKKSDDGALKKTLSAAYYKRATALTEARQYASALGDYRRALKNDAGNTDAKEWIDKIIMIYQSMGRESPPEGEEPPPLQLNKTN